MKGIFKGWVEGKGFGFVTLDDGGRDVFVMKKQISDPDSLARGAVLEIEYEENEKGRAAKHIDVILSKPEVEVDIHPDYPSKREATVKVWFEDKGYGFLRPHDGGDDIFVHRVSLSDKNLDNLNEGDVVSFLTTQAREGLGATDVSTVGWEETGNVLQDYADLSLKDWLPSLAEMAEAESWGFQHSKTTHSYPVLRSYIRYTFHRLTEIDGGVKITDDGKYSAFNTGLATNNQESIFGIFRKNNNKYVRNWVLDGFYKESDRKFVDMFGSDTPPLAEYFENPADLLFDRRLNLFINVDHIMDNISRFPKHLQENEYMARQLLTSAQTQTEKRVYRNYKTAVPQYFRDRGGRGELQLLLPICLEDPTRADLALTLAKNAKGDAYLSSTILTLDMAYCNARLLARPDTEWLKP